MTAKAAKAPPIELSEAELRQYTPEEVHEKRLLPYTPGTLRKKAQRHEIPHARVGGPRGPIRFRLSHIREIAAAAETRPISELKPDVSAKAPAA